MRVCCRYPSWKKPYSTAASARCSLATPNKPASLGAPPEKSLEVYSRIALTDAQHSYDEAIDRFPV
jgi:hypothetical protein